MPASLTVLAGSAPHALAHLAASAAVSPGSQDVAAVAPAVVVAATAVLVIVADWFLPDRERFTQAALALFGLLGAGALLVLRWGAPETTAFLLGNGSAAVVDDPFGRYAQAILLVAAAATIVLGADLLRHLGEGRGDLFALTLVATAGMMLMVQANDLVLLFLCLETFSLALYVMAAYVRGERVGTEAAFKYFILGSVAAAFFLYGAALLYASTGSTNLVVIGAGIAALRHGLPLVAGVGLGMLLVGLGFKTALVPFHQWTPDVYEGAPTAATAFFAAVTKVAAFAALARVLWTAFPALGATWGDALAALAVLTMLVGNLGALVQSSLKRMLAYSAIAHAGYLLVAVIAGGVDGTAALLFYLLVYAVMNIGAFAALVALTTGRRPLVGADRLDALRGLGRRQPVLAASLAVFLLGLTGLPPTAGFLGKWYVFQAAIGAGRVGLALAVVLASVLSAFYYLRPVVYMYAGRAEDEAPVAAARPSSAVVAAAALFTVLALAFAAPLVTAARGAGSFASEAARGTPDGAGRVFVPIPDRGPLR